MYVVGDGGSSGGDGDSDGGGVCGGGSFVLAVSQDNHHRLPLAGYGVQLTGCLDGCFSSYVWHQAATHPRDVRH